jgi:hypothetical protein
MHFFLQVANIMGILDSIHYGTCVSCTEWQLDSNKVVQDEQVQSVKLNE